MTNLIFKTVKKRVLANQSVHEKISDLIEILEPKLPLFYAFLHSDLALFWKKGKNHKNWILTIPGLYQAENITNKNPKLGENWAAGLNFFISRFSDFSNSFLLSQFNRLILSFESELRRTGLLYFSKDIKFNSANRFLFSTGINRKFSTFSWIIYKTWKIKDFVFYFILKEYEWDEKNAHIFSTSENFAESDFWNRMFPFRPKWNDLFWFIYGRATILS